MKLIFCILALLCPYVYGLAQPIPPQKGGLALGDIMQDMPLDNLQNYPIKKTQFSNFKKELTIIDFWATWCASCVASFPKLQSLQTQYVKQLQLLMVNGSPGEDDQKVNAFFKRRKIKTGQEFTLPYLLHDSIFSQLFPHQTIPHCVWIDANNQVIAITESSEVTAANIEQVLAGNRPLLPFKDDALLFNNETDELLPAGAGEENGLLYRSIIMAGKKELGSKVYFEEAANGLVKKLRVTNYSLLGLYQLSNPKIFQYGYNRLVMDSIIESLFAPQPGGGRGKYFSYELQTNPITRQEAMQNMGLDLQRYFGVTAVTEERLTPCFVMTAGKEIAQLHTKNGKPATQLDSGNVRNYISNGKPQELRGILEMLLATPVIDETGLTGNIDLEFPPGFLKMDTEQLTSFLAGQGIVLLQSERKLTLSRLKSTKHH